MMLEMRPLAEITQEALKILYKEIGVANTVSSKTWYGTSAPATCAPTDCTSKTPTPPTRRN